MELCKQLRQIRRLKNISQKEMAYAVGISQAKLSALENGKQTLSIDMLISISRRLDINPGKLLNEAYGFKEENQCNLTLVPVGDGQDMVGGQWRPNRLIS